MANKRVVAHAAITNQRKTTNANIIRYAITPILNERDARVTFSTAVLLIRMVLPVWWCVFNYIQCSFVTILSFHF